MHRRSTDQVDPKDRFERWREVRTNALFGLTAERSAGDIANAPGDSHCIFQPFGDGSRFGGDPDLVVRQRTLADSSRHLVRVAGQLRIEFKASETNNFSAKNQRLASAREQISEKFQNIRAIPIGLPLTNHGNNPANIFS